MTYRTWDTETTTRTSFKRKANPFDPENFVVMSGHKYKDGQTIGEYFGRDKKPFDWFTKLLLNTRILVGQNIKFDLLYALREPQNLEAWMDWVAGGGNVWDIQLAEYLLNGMGREDQMLSMDEMAPRYGGDLKIDEVKLLWNAGVDTIDIDRDLLTRYLVGTPDAHGDIGNTELIFLKQLARARDAGQVKSILLNMGSLLCTIEMERNGMCIDEERGRVLAAALAEELAVIKAALNTFLPADLPPELEFNWTNRYHLSPLIYGGFVKFERRVPVLDEAGNKTYSQMKVEHYVLVDGNTTAEPPNAETAMLYVTFKGGKNAGEFKTKQVSVDDPAKLKTRMEDFFYEFKQQAVPKKKWMSDTQVNGKNLYSVAGEVIEELCETSKVPFLQTLGKVAKTAKDLGTYYITEDPKKPGHFKGMLTLVQNGIIHHSINHTSTVTGRFSSSDPNLQNIPSGKKSDVKTVFVSRWGDDGLIVQSDFSALEIYVQAIITKCAQLILDLQAGLDMHCVRVSQKEGIPYEEALLKCKGGTVGGVKVAALPEWEDKRQGAKEYSFQRAYGAGVATISDKTGIPPAEVEAFIAADDKRYPEIPKFYVEATKQIINGKRTNGKVYPHPDNKNIMCNIGHSFYRTPDNKLYRYEESPSPEFLLKRGQATGFSPTEIKNYFVQGTGGEWAKAAMWLAVREYYRNKNFGGFALLVNQVHDALYGDHHRSVHREASVVLHSCMEAASEFMEWYFDWPVPVPVPSVTEFGPNMGESEEYKDDEFKAACRVARLALRQRYINNYQPSFEKA